MTKIEQTRLLQAFLDSMKDHLMSMAPNMPESWDGIELRQYCADQFAREVHAMGLGRKRAYLRDVARNAL